MLTVANAVPVSMLTALIAVIYGLVLSRWIVSRDSGTKNMTEIADAIREGAVAYLKRQYRIVAVVAVLVAVILAVFLGINTALGFILGAAATSRYCRLR